MVGEYFSGFIISGFWHGANYTFLIWGAIHGLLYLVERGINARKRLPQTRLVRFIGGVLIFASVNLAWLFFRIDTLTDVPNHVSQLFHSTGATVLELTWPLVAMLGVFLVFELLLYNNRIDRLLDKFNLPLRWTIYALFVWCITAWAGVTNHPFIYFQF